MVLGYFAGNLPFEKHFHESCNSHDRYYSKHVLEILYSKSDRKALELTCILGNCGKTPNQCDNELKKCARQQGLNAVVKSWLERLLCLGYTEAVNIALEAFGGIAFKRTTNKYCDRVKLNGTQLLLWSNATRPP